MGVLLLEEGIHWGRIVYEKIIIVKKMKKKMKKKSAKNARIMVCPIFAELPTPLFRFCLIMLLFIIRRKSLEGKMLVKKEPKSIYNWTRIFLVFFLFFCRRGSSLFERLRTPKVWIS